MNKVYVILVLAVCQQDEATANDNQTIVIEKGCTQQYFHATQQYFYIYNNESTPSTPPPSCDKNVTVPDGYIVTPGVGAHKYHTENKNWNDARNACIKEGAHLAVINSKEEQQLFVKYLNDHNFGGMWTGVHCQFKLHDWVTVLDVPLDSVGYKNWNKDEPNNVNGNEFCVEITNHSGLNDLNCEAHQRYYICEIDID